MNAKYLKGSEIMLLRKKMKKDRNQLQNTINKRDIIENKRRNVIRLDIESQTTENAYSQNGDELIVNRFDDEQLNSNDRDIRLYFNKSCRSISQSNMKESDNEFDRRQYRISQQLKHKNKMEDKKYDQ